MIYYFWFCLTVTVMLMLPLPIYGVDDHFTGSDKDGYLWVRGTKCHTGGWLEYGYVWTMTIDGDQIELVVQTKAGDKTWNYENSFSQSDIFCFFPSK